MITMVMHYRAARASGSVNERYGLHHDLAVMFLVAKIELAIFGHPFFLVFIIT